MYSDETHLKVKVHIPQADPVMRSPRHVLLAEDDNEMRALILDTYATTGAARQPIVPQAFAAYSRPASVALSDRRTQSENLPLMPPVQKRRVELSRSAAEY